MNANKKSHISLKDVQEVEIEPPKADDLASSEEKMFAHTEKMQGVQLGWIGRRWGARTEKPGNISAIIALVFAILLGILIFYWPEHSNFDYVFHGLSSIITLILGYLFGSSDR